MEVPFRPHEIIDRDNDMLTVNPASSFIYRIAKSQDNQMKYLSYVTLIRSIQITGDESGDSFFKRKEKE